MWHSLQICSLSCVDATLQVQNSLALGTSPVVRALIDPEGGMRDVRALDRVSFTDWFKSHGGSQGSIDRMWYASHFLSLCWLQCLTVSVLVSVCQCSHVSPAAESNVLVHAARKV